MTQYTFKPTASTSTVKWSNPAVWVGGAVPNGPDADVDFPIVTQSGSGTAYVSNIYIDKGESFAVRSVALRDYLTLDGSLTVSGQLTRESQGGIELRGSTLTAGSILNSSGQIQGEGRIVVGTLTNNAEIVGGRLTIDANTFINTGLIAAGSAGLTVNVGAGGFSSLSGGTLTNGQLAASSGGVLAIRASGPIVTDAASIRLVDGGTITSFDPMTGRDVPITTSLKTIAAQGSLTLQGGASYHFDDLTVAGSVQMQNGSLTVDRLAIAGGGHLDGVGVVFSAIRNDGIIRAGLEQGSGQYSGILVLHGAITGTGSLEVSAGHVRAGRFDQGYASLLEIDGPNAQNVKFGNQTGTLVLDQPGSFTGAITTGGSIMTGENPSGDQILLGGVALGSITNQSYVGNSAGGTLTLQQGSGALTLKFLGSHDLSNFTLTAQPGALSIDPQSTRITVMGRGAIPTQDFNGNGEADLMWLSTNGNFQSWSNRTPVGASSDMFTTNAYSLAVGPNWSITDSFDFNGDGYADILWRNTDSAVSVWTGSASSAFRPGAFNANVSTDWKIAGAGDFNGDGKGDILWRNDDGSITTWASTGTAFQQQAYNHASVGTDWKVAGVGDFNGDGKADIFWRNERDGATSVWNSTGSGFQESSFFQGPLTFAWHAQGIGDFNGDGFDDIFWRNDSGDTTVWLGSPTGFTQNAFYNSRVPAGWNVATVGDFNGDKLADLMWRHADGYTSIWNSTGSNWNVATFDTGVGNDWTLGGHIFPL